MERRSTDTAKSTSLLGALLLAQGILFVAVALRWIPADTQAIHAPREVLLAAGLLFVFAAIAFIGNGRLPEWISGLIGAGMWSGFAAIPAWIAWGSGPREFGGDGLWLLALVGLDFQSLGRTVFGLSALVMLFCASLAWWRWIKSLPPLGRVAGSVAIVAAVAWIGWLRYLEPAWAEGELEQDRLAKYVDMKFADPDVIADPQNPYLRPISESWIKKSRARLAAAREAPRGTGVIDLPRASSAPQIDGVVDPNEWAPARRFVSTSGRGAVVLMMVCGSKLYLAGLSLKDRTEGGFDQFRFYYDLALAPSLDNERVFVSRHGSVSTLRAVRPSGSKYEKTDWNILDRVASASAVRDHRQFELAIDLDEAGLAPGTQFPFFVEIEGDPIKTPQGKFKARLIEGRIGEYKRPIWARVPN
jgi:hypothetical protein